MKNSMSSNISIICILLISFVCLFQSDADAVEQYFSSDYATLRQAGSGFESMHFASSCYLGQLYEESGDLYFKQNPPGEGWQGAERIGVSASAYTNASLYYVTRDDGAGWEAYITEGSSIHQYTRNSEGVWNRGKRIASVTQFWFEGWEQVVTAMDSNNIIHFAVLDGSWSIKYFQFDGSTTTTSEMVKSVSNNLTQMWGFTAPHTYYPPRNLSLAVDSNGVAHLVYSVDQREVLEKGLESDLYYSTNSSGDWVETVIIAGVNDDAGLGASIAVAPNGTIAVASTYMPRRINSGSQLVAQLRYLIKKDDESWESTIVSQTADGYTAPDYYFTHDQNRGTGLYPYLQFDGLGKPHIVFSDHAGEHLPGAISYSGQLRYATRPSATSGSWELQTLVKQPTERASSRRLDNPAIETSSATCGNQIAIYGVSREIGDYQIKPTFTGHFFNNQSIMAMPGSDGGITSLAAPTLTATTSGFYLNLSWTSVYGATGYRLYYAPYPYTGAHTIGQIDLGDKTSFSKILRNGTSYYVATAAYNDSAESAYSNIELFTIETSETDPETLFDDDGDGYTESMGDCDDGDSRSYPTATDICGDGINQDCIGADAICATTEYTDNGDGTVTSNPTGLVWQQFRGPKIVWDEAANYCNGLTLGGSSSWRLPSIDELMSLYDENAYSIIVDRYGYPENYATNIDLSFFPDALGEWKKDEHNWFDYDPFKGRYWSLSLVPNTLYGPKRYGVNFYYPGETGENFFSEISEISVRCVR